MLITAASQRGMVGLHLLCFQGELLVGSLLYFNDALGTALQRRMDGTVRYLEGVRAQWVTALSEPLTLSPSR